MSVSEEQVRLVSLSERVYRALLTMYPKEFRQEYGPQMNQLFRDQCREELDSGGVVALAGLWFRTLLELVSTARRERDRKRRSEVVGKREPLLAAVVNLLIWPGMGQIYNRQMIKGFVLLFAYFGWIPVTFSLPSVAFHTSNTYSPIDVLWPVAVVIWVWSVWDAYSVARKTNASIAVE